MSLIGTCNKLFVSPGRQKNESFYFFKSILAKDITDAIFTMKV